MRLKSMGDRKESMLTLCVVINSAHESGKEYKSIQAILVLAIAANLKRRIDGSENVSLAGETIKMVPFCVQLTMSRICSTLIVF